MSHDPQHGRASPSADLTTSAPGIRWRAVFCALLLAAAINCVVPITQHAIVTAANGSFYVEGTYLQESGVQKLGIRVGKTVLRMTKLTDIISPGAAQRAVFIDAFPAGYDFYVYYLYPKWSVGGLPPIHHSGGVTLSMADGHAEYWKWKGHETVEIRRKMWPRTPASEIKDREPQTEDGLYDLQRLQRATWGRLGYSAEEVP